jgi:hypothetical protein
MKMGKKAESQFWKLGEFKFSVPSMGFAIGIANGSTTLPVILEQPKAVRLVQLAHTDTAVAKVFGLLGNKDAFTWVGLYRVHEVIEHDVGGRKALIKLGWVSDQKLKRFTHSSNSVAVAGDQARHGKETTQPPKDPMSLSEAKTFINRLLDSWFTSKGIA